MRAIGRESSVSFFTNHVTPRLIGLAVVTACVGCGPFGYLKNVASEATRAVAEAEAAGAEEYAPYEYWGAVAYLEQAKILMGYSEYERSFDFGERAKQLAGEAKVKAQRVKEGKSVVHGPGIPHPGQVPPSPEPPVVPTPDDPPAPDPAPPSGDPEPRKVGDDR